MKKFKNTTNEARRMLSTLISNLPGMVYRCRNDKAWTMEYVSSGSEELTGYAPEQLIDNRDIAYADLMHDEYRNKVWEKVQKGIEERSSFRVKYPIKTATGEEKWVWEKGRGVYGANGELLALEGFITDISEQIKAQREVTELNEQLEEKVRKRTAKLQQEIMERQSTEKKLQAVADELYEQKELLRELIDNTNSVICIKDLQGKYILVNEQYRKLFGKGKGSFEGKTYHDIFPEKPAGEFVALDTKVAEENKLIETEEEVPQQDGTHTYISVRFPLHNRKGEVFAVCNVSTDITERKKAERKLARHSELLEEANKELEAFSYSVSHDLRAPLRAIDGYARILLEDYAEKLDDEGKRFLNVITENSTKMGRLIDDLLAFSRTGRQEMNRVNFSMQNLFEEVYKELQEQYGKREVEFKLNDMPEVRGDRVLLRQVVHNLLGNAIKYSSRKKNSIIEAGTEQNNGQMVFYVKDNGAGFDMKYKNKLFGVFQRLHSDAEFEGNGVGLALVQRIIHRHEGKVWATGEKGEGATFYFSLPNGKKS